MKYTTPDGDVIECTVSEYMELKAADKPATKLGPQRFVVISQELLDVFDVIRQYGPISRTDLATIVELEPQQVSNLIQRLKVKGLVTGTDGHSTWELTPEASTKQLLPRVVSA